MSKVWCLAALPALALLAAEGPASGQTPACSGATVVVAKAAAPRCLALKETFRDCDATCPEMVVVPAGTFVMGSPANEPSHSESEAPTHQVTLAAPFAVGKFAVTFAEWDACAAAGGCNGYSPADQGWGRGTRPVINVSFDDANAYAAWLSQSTGKTYRLPSEAEREYFARGGTTTPFWWGNAITTALANYDGTATPYAGGEKGEFRRRTLPVDSFAANPFGLYNVHGNVDEWTADCYHNSYVGAPADGSAWTGGTCSFRVLRGGSFAFVPRFLRAAVRHYDNPGSRSVDFGFRLVRPLGP